MKRLILAGVSLFLTLGPCSTAWAQRPNLNGLPPAERRALANLIIGWLEDEGNVMWHMDNIEHSLARGVNTVDGRRGFFNGHRQYIRRLEAFLAANGGGRFVPLPKWDPASPIPPEFDFVKPGPDRGPLLNLDPRQPMPTWFMFPAVCRFRSIEDLYNAIMPWHDSVHNTVGGAMSDMMNASAAPIFFCWHAFTDDIYADWLRCRSSTGGSRGGCCAESERSPDGPRIVVSGSKCCGGACGCGTTCGCGTSCGGGCGAGGGYVRPGYSGGSYGTSGHTHGSYNSGGYGSGTHESRGGTRYGDGGYGNGGYGNGGQGHVGYGNGTYPNHYSGSGVGGGGGGSGQHPGHQHGHGVSGSSGQHPSHQPGRGVSGGSGQNSNDQPGRGVSGGGGGTGRDGGRSGDRQPGMTNQGNRASANQPLPGNQSSSVRESLKHSR